MTEVRGIGDHADHDPAERTRLSASPAAP